MLLTGDFLFPEFEIVSEVEELSDSASESEAKQHESFAAAESTSGRCRISVLIKTLTVLE